MMQTLWIPGELPGLNEIIGNARTHWAKSAKQKKEIENSLLLFCRKLKPVRNKADYQFHWICKNCRRDPDNIASAVKFIFDAMQHAGIIKNDGWDQVGSINHRFQTDKQSGVLICINEEL